jgi:hypothetical protein
VPNAKRGKKPRSQRQRGDIDPLVHAVTGGKEPWKAHIDSSEKNVQKVDKNDEELDTRSDSLLSSLPGHNPYDKAVATTEFTYADAKQREEVILIQERQTQAKLATEAAQIALDKEKLAFQQQRGELILKSEYLIKQEIIISTFKDLLSLVITESVVNIPSHVRPSFQETISRKVNAALTSVSKSVQEKQPRDLVFQNMQSAFKAE